MSFVEVEDVIDVNERMLAHVFAAVGGPEVELPLPRLPYDEAIARFGTDRPDTPLRPRAGRPHRGPARDRVQGLPAERSRAGARCAASTPARRDLPRSELDGLIERAQELGAKGLVWAFREGDGWRSPTAKFLSEAELAALNGRLGAAEGDLLLVVADRAPVAGAVLGQLRLDLGERFGLDPRGRERAAAGSSTGR